MHLTPTYFFRRFWRDYLLGIGFILITNVLAASVPWLVKSIIDALRTNHNDAAIERVAWILAIVAVMYGVRIASRVCLIGVGRKIEYDVRIRLYKHLMTMPRSYYDVQQTGDLMSRLTNDLASLRMFLGGGVMLVSNVVIAYATILPLMTRLSAKLTLYAFCLYPFIIVLMRIASMRVKTLSRSVQAKLADLTAVAQENLSGIDIIRAYAKEAQESKRFYASAKNYFTVGNKLARARALLYIITASAGGLSVLVILGEGGREVILGTLSISGFTAFMLYLERLSWPTVSMGWILSSFQQGLVAMERLNHIFNAQPTITDTKATQPLQMLPEGDLRVCHLSFAYDNTYQPSTLKAPDVLHDINFTVRPGELVAIVGPIGAGKTTLLNLLARLYGAPHRTIFFGETAIEEIPLQVLRQNLTLMPQNSFLFSSSIQSNIAYADPMAELGAVTDTAQLAQIHDEIMGLPQTYQTMVGERGVTLSGGQRQRTALARTVLAIPEILLLDDPFSSVDNETEQAIIEALRERKILQHRTTIFASQRFNLVRQADKIIVLSPSGHLDAQGSHAELLETSALYRALSQQSQDVEPEGMLA